MRIQDGYDFISPAIVYDVAYAIMMMKRMRVLRET